MTANEMEIATADKIIINHGTEYFPETDIYIRQPSTMRYKLLSMSHPIDEVPQYAMTELIRRLFEQNLVDDYTIQYEERLDHKGRNLPSETVAYLYLKEEK